MPRKMAPITNNRRRSVRLRSSPRGFGITNMTIRKQTGFRVKKYADRNQVDVLQKGLNLLNSGGAGGPSVAPGAEVDVSRKAPMKVAVRVRPMNARETAGNAREIISVNGGNMLVFDPERKQDDFFYRNQKIKDITARKFKNLKFAFDHVYDHTGTNPTIYEEVMKPLLNTLMSGFNCSVFAYGATGSGKTYTMLGSSGNPGLTYLTINDLYDRLDSMQADFETEIVISYFEVYNEQVRDLLNPTGDQLMIMEAGNGIDIKNLTFHRPNNIEHLLEMLRHGNANRSQHPTDHNSESSRSHAVLQVHIRMRERHKDISSSSRTSKLVMVDLAGSEKGCATAFTGQRFREGSSINKSLLALGKVMEALASGKKAFSFRDSKLTRILKDSLGGNCRTVMIANISPAETLYDDTLNTLRYAQKAKKISCNASKNIITVQSCLTEYTRVVDEMTAKIQGLEQQLKEKDIELEGKNKELKEREETIGELELRALVAEQRLKEVNTLHSTGINSLQPKNDTETERELSEAVAETRKTDAVLKSPTGTFDSVIDCFDKQNFSDKDTLDPIYDQFEENILIPTFDENISAAQPPNESYVVAPSSISVSVKEFIDEGNSFNTNIRPSLEKHFLDFNLKLEQYCQLHSLSVSTKDERYEKAKNKVLKKLECLSNTLQNELHGTSGFLTSNKSPLNLPTSTVTCITLSELVDLLINKTLLGIATNENKMIHQYLNTLVSTLTRREELLKEFALLSNKMLTNLKHFDRLAPSDREQYDKLVSAYCTLTLQFKDNSPFYKGITCSNALNKKNSMLSHQDDCLIIDPEQCKDIMQYFKIAEERLNGLLGHIGDNVDLHGSIENILKCISTKKCVYGDLDLSPISTSPRSDGREDVLGYSSVECQSQEEVSLTQMLEDHSELLTEELLKNCTVVLPLSNEVLGYSNNDELNVATSGSSIAFNKTVTLANSTFTLEEELEINENDNPDTLDLDLCNLDFTDVKTMRECVAEFLNGPGATNEPLKHSKKDDVTSCQSMPKSVSPAILNQGNNSASLTKKIPVRNFHVQSSSPKRPYSVVGAKKVIASTGKIQNSQTLVPQKRSPYAKSKKTALATVRSVSAPSQQQQQKFLVPRNKPTPQQKGTIWLKGPQKSNSLNGNEGR